MACLIHGESRAVVLVMALCMAILLTAMVSLICLVLREKVREMRLCSRLIEQKEATQQAERKSMRKSKAFVEASHNIRTSLACLTALVDNSYSAAASAPELQKNLQQMEKCVNDLLGILNAVLDTSKIEAGAVLLEDEEFDMAQLVEGTVDLFHPYALKKNVDMVLDLSDGSVIKNSLVRGDRVKLNQIISNLLHNAVKFTAQGHITVRVSAQRMSLEGSIITYNQNKGWGRNLRGFFFGKEEASQDILAPQRRQSCVNFVFEVDDTGKGIPKEKWESVFEDYNQIKDGSIEHGGTGLGLGSVQSLVRLMDGDIKIVDKGMGMKGTCFRFNVLLPAAAADHDGSPEKSTGKDDLEQCHPLTTVHNTRSPSRPVSIQDPSPRWPAVSSFSPRPAAASSRVILVMPDGERRKVSEKFLKRLIPLGIRVSVTSHWNDLPLVPMTRSCSGSTRKGSSSGGSSPRSHHDHHSRGGFVLLIIDTYLGLDDELVRDVREFQRWTQMSGTADCKVIWLDNKATGHSRRVLRQGGMHMVDPKVDIVLSKPFHGTRLFEAIRLLPEFGGNSVNLKERNIPPTAPSPPPPRAIAEPLQGKRVLLVEDNGVLQMLTKMEITRLGASVGACSNGADAVSMVLGGLAGRRTPTPANGASSSSSSSMHAYDLVLMDCEMPVMNGYEATRVIRKEEKRYGIRIPIIALTAHSPEPDIWSTCKAAGMDSCLPKPFNGAQLMQILHKLNIT
ncbi:hypothetical protein SAY87_016520 [Trapa incisa]|uniref:histidine kinase n=1 Tax=Trapa incisa TaxID=236973 RepID=A0AAN7L9E3_9MYRT|nr:hypothetical protein SAY87_016520 [Trapa incisa]